MMTNTTSRVTEVTIISHDCDEEKDEERWTKEWIKKRREWHEITFFLFIGTIIIIIPYVYYE